MQERRKTYKHPKGGAITTAEIMRTAFALFFGRYREGRSLFENGAQFFIPIPSSLLHATEIGLPLAKYSPTEPHISTERVVLRLVAKPPIVRRGSLQLPLDLRRLRTSGSHPRRLGMRSQDVNHGRRTVPRA